jgi:glycosyltransferase involved in cell wall biosynthesis
MTRLARRFDILYMERFNTRDMTWRELLAKAWNRLLRPRPSRTSNEMHGIRFVSLGWLGPHDSQARRQRNIDLARAVAEAASPHDWHCRVLWISNPSYVALEFLDSLCKADRTVYDCVQRFEYNRNYPPDIGEIDREIARRVDVVFADSKTIFEEKRALNENTYHVPQGVDVDRFLCAGVNRTPPDELRWLKRPIFGYHGAWHQAFDPDLVAAILDNVKDSTFAFVGPTDGREKAWKQRYPQAVFLGPRDHVRLGRYVNGFDVCLVPYRIDAHTRGVFPTKFFEYVATGLPIVSTDLPDLREYTEWVDLAGNREAFVEAAKAAVDRERRPVEEVRAFVEQHTWDRRVERMLERLGPDLCGTD